jgi:hypothetical protein
MKNSQRKEQKNSFQVTSSSLEMISNIVWMMMMIMMKKN